MIQLTQIPARRAPSPLPWLLLLGLAAGLTVGCDEPEVLAVATRDGNELELLDARGQITQDATLLDIEITGWSNPSCRAVDDEVSVTATLRVADVAAVPLGEPVDVAAPGAPVEAILSMGSMGRLCSQDCEGPVYTLTGTVTFDELSATRACGSLDLLLQGDIPASGQLDQAYQRDSSLSLTWRQFCAPMDVDHCQ